MLLHKQTLEWLFEGQLGLLTVSQLRVKPIVINQPQDVHFNFAWRK